MGASSNLSNLCYSDEHNRRASAYFGEVGQSLGMTYGISNCQHERVLLVLASCWLNSSPKVLRINYERLTPPVSILSNAHRHSVPAPHTEFDVAISRSGPQSRQTR